MLGVVDILVVTASNARKDLVIKGSKKIVFIICLISSDFLKPIWEIIHLPDLATCISQQGIRANSAAPNSPWSSISSSANPSDEW
jgi:hypothetical protein